MKICNKQNEQREEELIDEDVQILGSIINGRFYPEPNSDNEQVVGSVVNGRFYTENTQN